MRYNVKIMKMEGGKRYEAASGSRSIPIEEIYLRILSSAVPSQLVFAIITIVYARCGGIAYITTMISASTSSIGDPKATRS